MMLTMRRREIVTGGAASLVLMGSGVPLFAARPSGSPVVDTTGGRLRGQSVGGISRFLGVPYGADTGGANRFLPPKPAAPWAGIRDAITYGPSAPQSNPAGRIIPPSMKAFEPLIPSDPPGLIESEDCLRLNVWTPSANRQAHRPVMVYLHGGGLTLGSGSWIDYEGTNFARANDMVVVTVNHRLNMFGYAYLAEVLGADYRMSSNAGQLDIVLALKWVRDNIAAFGGDPNNVTIRGQSGGGTKVAVLMAMPAAHGLFHKAIIESGPTLRAATAESGARNAALLTETLGGKDKLRTASTKELITAFYAMQGKSGGSASGLAGGFSPVVDGGTLPRNPFEPDATPLSADIPLLIGSTKHEQAMFMFGQDVPDEAALLKSVERAVTKAPDRAIAAYRAAYPKASLRELAILINTDAGTGSRTRLLADRKSAQPAPVFAYRFDWESKIMGGTFMARHGGDTSFIFDNTGVDPYVAGDPTAKPLAARCTRAWGAFMRTGNPSTSAGFGAWPRYAIPGRPTMVINNRTQVVSDPDGKLRELVASLA